jgi:DNA-binding NarL/FixJ family response regulator
VGTTSETIRVLVVDDHELFRRGVSSILRAHAGFEVVGEAEDGAAAVRMYRETSPDVVITDIHMPVLDGLEATRQIKQLDPQARILMLTATDADDALLEAMKAGALGYVVKTASPPVVIEAIGRVRNGEPVIPGHLAVRIIHELSLGQNKKAAPEVDALTEREIEVLQLLSTGASNREIGTRLYISENTVRNHVRNILEKLHLHNRVQAAAYALREGYALPEDADKDR